VRPDPGTTYLIAFLVVLVLVLAIIYLTY